MAEKILVADDSLTIQKVVAITLANEPWTLVEATDESELFAKLKSNDFKLVLLDFNLSESKSGYELAGEIKKIAPGINIFVMLGTFDSVEDSELKSAGIDERIVKPFDSQKFIQKCRDLVDRGASGLLSDEEKEGLAFDEEVSEQESEDISDWVMDAPARDEEDMSGESDDSLFDELQADDGSDESWDEDTAPGIRADDFVQKSDMNTHSKALESELAGWGVSIPAQIGLNDDALERPPVIGNTDVEIESDMSSDIDPSSIESDDDMPFDDFDLEGEQEVQATSIQNNDENDSMFPDDDDLGYPDLSVASDDNEPIVEFEIEEDINSVELAQNAISIDELVQEDDSDDDIVLSLRVKPEAPREDLAREIESEQSADDFWAIDEYEGSEKREDFVVGVGDPQAPIEPVKPSQASELNLSKSANTSFDEERLIEKVKASLAPMLEDIVRRYMDEKVEKVAWEIIPDVAENLIRKEIKEITQGSKES